jgi:hypothetical protein
MRVRERIGRRWIVRGCAAATALAASALAGSPSRADAAGGAGGSGGVSVHHAPRDALAARFAADPSAQLLALSLFDADGDDVDTLPAQAFDGGYRGTIQLVPALPVGPERKHLAWVAGALRDFDAFFSALGRATTTGPAATARYRWRGLRFHFFRSVGNTTPNAFAWGWDVAYNVHGSIDTTPDAVRETLFHEIFHLDDADHGDWSVTRLGSVQAAIERRCGARTACLAPYAPTATIVRNGTYYAFQPGNDAREYAAEVATRFYVENRAIALGLRPVTPAFKCGPTENRAAWDAIKGEFFNGIDLVPDCGRTEAE